MILVCELTSSGQDAWDEHTGKKMPRPHSRQSSSLRVCSSCAATVDRKNCHKNRYSQYICQRCQEAGVRFLPRKERGASARRRFVLKWALSVFFLVVAVAGLVLPTIWMNTLTTNSSSSLSRKAEALIDTQGGVLLDAENRARLIEGLERRVFPSRTEKP